MISIRDEALMGREEKQKRVLKRKRPFFRELFFYIYGTAYDSFPIKRSIRSSAFFSCSMDVAYEQRI